MRRPAGWTMSTETKLIEMEPTRFKPDKPLINRLEQMLQLAKEGKISAVGIAMECVTDDGVGSVDWFLVGRLAWPTALVGCIDMLLDEAKDVVKEKVAGAAT